MGYLEEKQRQLDMRYLRMASIWAENSYCVRRKVGALIVKDKMIISDGYNGNVFSVEPPLFVELEITDTEPGFKGDTAQGATKPAVVETGKDINIDNRD